VRAQVRRKKGGWKALAGLWWDEVKEVFSFAEAAAWAGKPLSFVTVRPCDTALEADDTLRKRNLCNKAKDIIQAIGGRGKVPRQPAVPAVTVYEKRPGSFLHAHMLAHVAPGNDALARVSDGTIIRSRPAVPSDAGYLTKQRLPLSPEFEATTTHKRQASVKIPGPRRSFNADAVALMAAHAEAMQAQCYSAPVVTEASPLLQGSSEAAPAQIDLFPGAAIMRAPSKSRPVRTPVAGPAPHPVLPLEAELIDLAARAEAIRIARDETQEHFADKHLGLSQGGYANWLRHHDKLGQWRINRLIEFIRQAA
jgi:hypothetical protein